MKNENTRFKAIGANFSVKYLYKHDIPYFIQLLFHFYLTFFLTFSNFFYDFTSSIIIIRHNNVINDNESSLEELWRKKGQN